MKRKLPKVRAAIGDIVVQETATDDAPSTMAAPVTAFFFGTQHSEPLIEIEFQTLRRGCEGLNP